MKLNFWIKRKEEMQKQATNEFSELESVISDYQKKQEQFQKMLAEQRAKLKATM